MIIAIGLSLTALVLIAATALAAATVNGAIGYGFSSITVPIALNVLDSKVLNPALVVLEVILNSASLWLNRRAVPKIWRLALPVIVGLAPGIVAGSLLLGVIEANALKAGTYAVLLPLILLQLAQYKLPLPAGRAASLPFGAALGVLYSTTTISGPPLALFFNNQGLAQDEFRAAISLVRVAESVFTLIAYAVQGYFAASSFSLAGVMLPAVLIGLPLGRWLILSLPRELFRRIVMAIDAVLVGFGLATTANKLQLAPPVVIVLALAGMGVLALLAVRRKAPTAT